MSRRPKPWWNRQKGTWCTNLGGKRRTLAHGYRNRATAHAEIERILQEQFLLASYGGAITVARLCEDFLTDAHENLQPGTYQSYQYGCQKFVDLFGLREAHTIRPTDINQFAASLRRTGTINETSQAIILRSVQRCFNWGVQNSLIPPHQLGRIRKPQSRTRDRYLTDEEFQLMLRSTNPRDSRRTGAPFRRLLLAMDWTLCRSGELVRLKWEHIHEEHDVAILTRHKTMQTGKPKVIPLIPKMKRLLAWLRQQNPSAQFVFLNSQSKPWTMSSIEQRMHHVKDRSGLVGVMPYSIRHRAATKSILKTGDLKMTSLLLGHTSTATTERYTHLAQEHLVNFAQKAAD